MCVSVCVFRPNLCNYTILEILKNFLQQVTQNVAQDSRDLLAIVASVLSAEEATYSILLLCQFYVTFHYGIRRAMESSAVLVVNIWRIMIVMIQCKIKCQ